MGRCSAEYGSASDLQRIYQQCMDISAGGELGPDEVCLWCFDLRAEPHVVAKAGAILSFAERERASRFATDLLRDNFIVARGILRILLSRYSGLPPESLEFDYGPQGKPFLTRCSCPISFNMSHSGEIAAYGFAWGCALGVDVEQHRDLPDRDEIAKRYFSRSEYCELMTVPERERAGAFYACWVRKEAFLKAKGGGLSIPLDSFQVSAAPDRPPAILSIDGGAREARRWSLHEFFPAAGYSGAVVCDSQRALRVHALRSAGEILEAPT